MDEKNHHIISRFKWHTQFDSKNRAAELQSKLSEWSRLKLEQHITAIFERYCPPGEVWRIDRLELNLGTVDYNHLEKELTQKIQQCLEEALQELLVAYYQDNSGQFKIISKEVSAIQAIQGFLLHGIFPWHYSHTERSFNELLLEQLITNSDELMEMLYTIAGNNRQVRKRMAWQVSEPNIIRIIKKAEPGNSGTIIQFANDMAVAQKNKTVVQAPSASFKKNVWHWVLNYLFTNHGSVFNKKEFLKSSVRQMAAHYNISYKELIEVITTLVINTPEAHHLSDDFVHLLKVLAAEEQPELTATTSLLPAQEEEELRLLSAYFSKPEEVKEDQQQSFSSLVLRLSQSRPARFAEITALLNNDKRLQEAAIHNLDDKALGACIKTISRPIAESIMNMLSAITGGATDAQKRQIRESAWLAAFDYLSSNGNQPQTLNGYLSCLAKQTGNFTSPQGEAILEHLLLNDIRPTEGAIINNNGATKAALLRLLQSQPEIINESRIRELAEKLSDSSASWNDFYKYQKLLLHFAACNPACAIRVVQQNKDIAVTDKIVSAITTNHSRELIEKFLEEDKAKALNSIAAYISSISSSGFAGIKPVLLRNVYREGVKEILTNPAKDISAFIESLLLSLYKKIPLSHSHQFKIFVAGLLTVSPHSLHSVSEPVKARLLSYYAETTAPANKHELIVQLYHLYFHGKKAGALPQIDNPEISATINSLLKDPVRLYQQLFNEYKRKFIAASKPVPENYLRNKFHEIFWKVLLDHNLYKGSTDKFIKHFTAAATLHLPVAEKPGTKLPGEDRHTGEGALLTNLLETCIKNNSHSITSEGRTHKLPELVEKLTLLYPDALVELSLRTGNRRIAALMIDAAVDFRMMASVLIPSLEKRNSNAAASLILFYEHIQKRMNGNIPEQVEKIFGNYLLQLVKGGFIPAGSFKKITADVFAILKLEKKDKTSTIALSKNSAGQVTLKKKPITRLLFRGARSGWLNKLISVLVFNEKAPAWFAGLHAAGSEATLLNSIVSNFPFEFQQFLKKEKLSEVQQQWLAESISFSTLVNAAERLNPSQRHYLKLINEFYQSLTNKTWLGITSTILQRTLARKILGAWLHGSWDTISPENTWYGIIAELTLHNRIQEADLLEDIKKNSYGIPSVLMQELDKITERKKERQSIPHQLQKTPIVPGLKKLIDQQGSKEQLKEGITVFNAGLVIINSYIPLLFGRLGICNSDSFVSEEVQLEAVHYLQYIVTGSSSTEESFLPLNKILCGLPVTQPVPPGINISDEAKELTESLVNAFIGFWPAIGHTSVEGFRGNWLVRTGILRETDEKWELCVEKKPYDVLLSKSPFSFSVIKFPWMTKPLHVTWPY